MLHGAEHGPGMHAERVRLGLVANIVVIAVATVVIFSLLLLLSLSLSFHE